jgi:hypothetical protein
MFYFYPCLLRSTPTSKWSISKDQHCSNATGYTEGLSCTRPTRHAYRLYTSSICSHVLCIRIPATKHCKNIDKIRIHSTDYHNQPAGISSTNQCCDDVVLRRSRDMRNSWYGKTGSHRCHKSCQTLGSEAIWEEVKVHTVQILPSHSTFLSARTVRITYLILSLVSATFGLCVACGSLLSIKVCKVLDCAKARENGRWECTYLVSA